MTCFFVLIQITFPKSVGKKLSEGEGKMLAFVFDEIDLECIGVAEFRHYLTANAAGGTLAVGDVICASCNGDSLKFGLTLADCLEKSDTLGAHRW